MEYKQKRAVTVDDKRREGRRATLLTLLDHWKDFFEEVSAEGVTRPDGCALHSPIPATDCPACAKAQESPRDWTLFSAMGREASVLELRRCVDILDRAGSRCRNGEAKVPVHHRHLMAFSAHVEWRLVDKKIKRRDVRGRWVDDIERSRERIVPSWVNRRIVESAIDMLMTFWNPDVPLELPPALTAKLREYVNPETGEAGWTIAA